ncbi:MAG: CBS domain-containing protein [Anaerolineae bacterium]|nr:CBS domain-containing protein [Anaerolineae bacterium]
MATVRDIIRKKGGEVYSIARNASVFEALKMMADLNTGALMVMAEGKVDGILSERDGVRRVELHGRSAKDTRVEDIMTSKVLYAQANQSIEECVAIMLDKNIRHLPVFEGDELIGFISARDALAELVDQQKFMISQLEHYITGGGR